VFIVYDLERSCLICDFLYYMLSILHGDLAREEWDCGVGLTIPSWAYQ
jgi:hypothetical protein